MREEFHPNSLSYSKTDEICISNSSGALSQTSVEDSVLSVGENLAMQSLWHLQHVIH